MSANPEPERRDQVDEAVHRVVEFLALTNMVEGELNMIAPSIQEVILAMLVAQEATGTLTPYREHLLHELRAAEGPAS